MAEYYDLRIQRLPTAGFPERTRVSGRLPDPDNRRFSQWGGSPEEAILLAEQRNPGLRLRDIPVEDPK